nr:hypothetical protein [uncultured Draconibacterium sp.]
MSTFKLSFFWGSLHAVFTDTIYSHPTGDGNLHVPANGTTNNGKVLTAGSIAGSYTWETPAQGVTDHTLLSNIGTNTHTAIDSHIADNTKHFTQAEIAITESQISDFGSYALAADVLTPVPLGAVFTDTVYDDTAIQAEVSLNTADRHTHTNKTVIDNTTASYTTTEQTKLSGIEEGANNYTLPFTDNSANWNTAYS